SWERRPDEKGDFAAHGFFFKGCREFRKRPAAELFVQLGDFASEASGTVAEDFQRCTDGFAHAMRSFVKDKRAVLKTQAFERTPTFTGTGGKEADEEKFLVGQAGGS